MKLKEIEDEARRLAKNEAFDECIAFVESHKLKQKKSWVDVWFILGIVQFLTKRFREAAKTFTVCIKIDPIKSITLEFWEYLGKCYINLNELNAAEEVYRRLLELSRANLGRGEREALDGLKSVARARGTL
ncbi:MAG: tetratricopeptide repeat protein [Candidatus Hodarchaeota archaeon]